MMEALTYKSLTAKIIVCIYGIIIIAAMVYTVWYHTIFLGFLVVVAGLLIALPLKIILRNLRLIKY